MASLKAGDVLVTKLDRLGRSTRELLELIERIGKAKERACTLPLTPFQSAPARATCNDFISIPRIRRICAKQ
jgi:hypothetical protein